MGKKIRKVITVLVSLCMIVSMMPLASISTYAASDTAALTVDGSGTTDECHTGDDGDDCAGVLTATGATQEEAKANLDAAIASEEASEEDEEDSTASLCEDSNYDLNVDVEYNDQTVEVDTWHWNSSTVSYEPENANASDIFGQEPLLYTRNCDGSSSYRAYYNILKGYADISAMVRAYDIDSESLTAINFGGNTQINLLPYLEGYNYVDRYTDFKTYLACNSLVDSVENPYEEGYYEPSVPSLVYVFMSYSMKTRNFTISDDELNSGRPLENLVTRMCEEGLASETEPTDNTAISGRDSSGNYGYTGWMGGLADYNITFTVNADAPAESGTDAANVVDFSWYTANTSATTFEISTAAQWRALAWLTSGVYTAAKLSSAGYVLKSGTTAPADGTCDQFSGDTINLTEDIDLGGSASLMTMPISGDYYINDNSSLGGPNGNSTSNDHRFKGSVNGNGHTISGIYMAYNNGSPNAANRVRAGLFGWLGGGTSSTAQQVIQGIRVKGTISSTCTDTALGGIAGIAKNVSNIVIKDCINEINLTGASTVGSFTGGLGGIIAISNGTDIQNCLNLGTISGTGTATKSYGLGGIAGSVETGLTVKNSLNMGTVTTAHASYKPADILGYMPGTSAVTNCYYSGTYASVKKGTTEITTGATKTSTLTNTTTALAAALNTNNADAWVYDSSVYTNCPVPKPFSKACQHTNTTGGIVTSNNNGTHYITAVVCEDCGETVTPATSAVSCTYGIWNSSTGKRQCKFCGYSQSCSHANTTGGVVTSNNNGTHYTTAKVCSTCRKTVTSATSATSCTYGAWDSSTGKRTCTKCGYSQTCSHATTTTLARIEPTCTSVGWTAGTCCSVCGKVLVDREEIPALGHTYTYAYTWSADGKTCTATATCKNDSSHKVTAAGTVTSVVKTAATCTTKGTTTYTANFTNSEGTSFTQQTKDILDIAALGHVEVVTRKGVPATCTLIGATDRIVCKVCNELLQEQEAIPATGHSYAGWKLEDSGKTLSDRCTSCQEGNYITLDLHLNNEIENVSVVNGQLYFDITEIKDGEIVLVKDKEITAKSMSGNTGTFEIDYTDGVKIGTCLIGDADGSGIITSADAGMMLLAASGAISLEGTNNAAALAVDGDGYSGRALRLLSYMARENDTLR